MRRKIISLLGALATASSLACVTAPTARAAKPPPNINDAGWNGYVTRTATATHQYTGVGAAWVVPDPQCDKEHNTAVGEWVGLGGLTIGGHTPTPLVQIGTLAQCGHTSSPRQGAVFEAVPPDSHATWLDTNRYPVVSGDHMGAQVQYEGQGRYRLWIGDFGQTGQPSAAKWSVPPFEQTVNDTSKPDSAEWIVEDPTLDLGVFGKYRWKLSPFGQVTFNGAALWVNGAGMYLSADRTDLHLVVSQDASKRLQTTVSDITGSKFTVTGLHLSP
jgi:hypothetical protein